MNPCMQASNRVVAALRDVRPAPGAILFLKTALPAQKRPEGGGSSLATSEGGATRRTPPMQHRTARMQVRGTAILPVQQCRALQARGLAAGERRGIPLHSVVVAVWWGLVAAGDKSSPESVTPALSSSRLKS